MSMLQRLCSTVGAGCAAVAAMAYGPAALGQYCTASAGTCGGILGERISRVQLGTIDNNQGTGNGPAGCYTDFTAISTNLLEGSSTPITVQNPAYFAEDAVTVWVDWNHDNVFGDAASGEEFVLINTFTDGSQFDGSIVVPPGALSGPARLRVRIVYDETPLACGVSDYGETEDYTVNVVSASQGSCCVAGNPACTLTTQAGCTGAFGGASSTCAPVNPCGGACCNAGVCTVTLAAGCTGGGIFINGRPCSPSACTYCTAGSDDCTGDERISRVQFNTINNIQGTANGPAGCYTDFTSIATTVHPGQSYAITVDNAAGFNEDQASVWVDWNRDFAFGDVASGEETVLLNALTDGSVFTGTVTVPAGASLGGTRLRIRLLYTGTYAPCGGSEYGEVEDYSVSVAIPVGGACCTAGSPSCTVGLQAACAGSYSGDGSTCAPVNPCGGSCCVGSTCSATTAAGCTGSYTAGGICGPASCTYCEAGSGNCDVGDERISRVTVSGIDNDSGILAGPAGCYTNFTSISTTVAVGATYPIVVANADGFDDDVCVVWVDWNRDFIFGDAASGERFDLVNTFTDGTSFDGQITVPAGTTTGPTRMRVRLLYDAVGNPCGNAAWGEVEDYTLNVIISTDGACCSAAGACTVTTQAGCAAPGVYRVGVPCGPSTCNGGCCHPATAICAVTAAADCTSPRVFQGVTTTCAPNPCPIPPQTNDTCDMATELFVGTAVLGNNFQASGDGTEGPGGACYFTGPDHFTKGVWFKFNPQYSTNYLVSACGSTFDSVLSAFSVTTAPACDNLVAIGCDDDTCIGTTDSPSPGPGPGNANSSVIASVPMVRGQTYYIRLAAWLLADGGGPYGIVVQYATGVTVGSCCIGTVCTQVDSTGCTGGTFTAGGSCSPDPCAGGPVGVCCRGSTCSTDLALQTQATCAATVTGTAGAKFVAAAACGGTNHRVPCCYADYTQNGVRDVSDIFAFLTDWFAARPWAVVGGTGTGTPAVSHIFAFLTDWFAGGCAP